MTNLTEKKCSACKSESTPLEGKNLAILVKDLGGEWNVINEHHLEKEYAFKNFKDALDFTNKIANLAEEEGHHPEIHLAWGKVRVVLWTHKINGLSESDFILAAKIDTLQKSLK